MHIEFLFGKECGLLKEYRPKYRSHKVNPVAMKVLKRERFKENIDSLHLLTSADLRRVIFIGWRGVNCF